MLNLKETILKNKEYIKIEEIVKDKIYDIYDKRDDFSKLNLYIPNKEVTILESDYYSTGSWYEVETEKISEEDFNYLMKELKIHK